MHTAIMVTLFFVLLGLTAFFNLAEMALVAARASRLEGSEHSAAAARVLELKRRPGLFLAAIRAGDLITDLLTGAFVVTWLEEAIRSGLHGVPLVGAFAAAAGSAAAFVTVSYLILVFGDLAPKSVALSAPERSAMLIATPLRLLIVVARPFFTVLECSNSLVLRILGVQAESEERVTEEEIRRTLASGLDSGVLVPFERSMMERVLDLDRRSIRTVMTGRPDIQFLRAGSDEETLRAAVMQATASRLLVTGSDGLDQLIGSVSRADVLSAIAKGDAVDLAAMAASPAYVAENASALHVFERLKSMSTHMLIVVDEFGSLLGLVTLADVLEAIAGDVTSDGNEAGDEEERPLQPESDGSYLIPGGYPLDDLVEANLLPKPAEQNYKTVAGFILDHLRRLPAGGEIIDLPTLRIEVVALTHGSIETLRLVRKPG